MIRTQIYIPEELHQAAKLIAKRKDRSLAKILRGFISQGIKEEKRKLKPKSLTSLSKLNITKGPKDLSSNMDSYLYKK
jgi:predicted DNA-binding protein